MPRRAESIQDELRARYQRSSDEVDLTAFLAAHELSTDERIAEVIEADGRIRIELGLPVELRRYLDAVPDLAEKITALDAGLEMVLRSEQRSGRTLAEAVDSLCRRYPGIEESIRDATTLSRLIHSGLFAPGASRGAVPGPTRVDEEGVERAGPPPSDSVPGYRLVAEIYRGGQGVVYKAVQESTERTVAVKVLSGGRFATEREQRRFEREIRLVAGLRHPSIVTIYDSGVHEGRHFYAMEFVEGEPLDYFVGQRKLGVEATLRLFARICDAVRYAHDRGIVHRDVKPQNIIVDVDGMPHLLDFGLAKGSAGPREAETITTEFVGTLAYASPEQLRGDPVGMDARTDVYALGLILFQLLTGRHAYDLRGDFVEVARRISEDRPSRPSALRPELNDDLDAIVLRAMAKVKERRYQSVDELARDVDHVLAGEAIRARHDSPWYLARAHYRTFVHRHFAIASAIMAVAACLAGQGLGVLIGRAVPVTRHVERAMATWASSAAHRPSLDGVRVIGFTDAAALERAALDLGVPGVSAGDVKSLRRLHGILLTALARSGAGVVVFDITFVGETAFDEDFADGVSAMRRAGADVIISTASWNRDTEGRPPISAPILAAGVGWGCASGRFRADEPWRVHLAVEKTDRDPEPSLALAAISSLRHPGALPSYDLDAGARSVDIHFSTESPTGNPRTRVPLDETETIDLTSVGRHAVPDAPLAIDRGDVVGTSMFQLPESRHLERRTIEYEDVLRMSDTALRETFAGTVVLVADRRPTVDRYDHADGRTGVSGVYAHAAAIGALLDGITIRYPDWEGWFLIALAAAIAGLTITRRTGHRRGRRAVLLGVAAIAIVVAAVLSYRLLLVLWNPLVPLLALLVAAQLASVAPPLERMRWR